MAGPQGSLTAQAEAELYAQDGLPEDRLGSVVAMSGNTAVLGAPLDDTPKGVDSGSAYVFEHIGSTWKEEARLLAPDGAQSDFFGSVAIDGDTIVVGAFHADTTGGTDAGAAYVFVRTAGVWEEQQKLMASDGNQDDLFGKFVAIAGDTIAVGAPLDDHAPGLPGGPAGQGSVYVFVRSGSSWSEQAKVTASPALAGDQFGPADLDGDLLIVGAPVNDAMGTEAGTAFMFTRSGSQWTQEAQLFPQDAGAHHYFGGSVSLSDNRALIGALGNDHAGTDSGAAYIFVDNGTWVEEERLVAPNPKPGDLFGYFVILDGIWAIVGVPQDDHSGKAGVGSAFLFVRNGANWSETVMFKNAIPRKGDFFGGSVSIDGATVLVGASGDEPEGVPTSTNQGAGHVFHLVLPPPMAYCTAGTSANGCQASVSGNGVPSGGTASGFWLDSSGVEGGKNGLYFFGANGRQANPWGNGTSYQCVVPPVKRAGLLSGTGTIGQCDGTFSQDLNALWSTTPAKNPGAGAVVQAQLWYRDPLNTSNQTTSLSDAIEFAVGP